MVLHKDKLISVLDIRDFLNEEMKLQMKTDKYNFG